MPPSPVVTIPMNMHLGNTAICVVKVGDYVKVGQVIGEANGQNSARIHASVSGTVSEILETNPVTGKPQVFVRIASDGLQVLDENLAPSKIENIDDFIVAVRNSGVVGLGGAAAPAVARFILPDPNAIDYFIINGAECEPYMTCDTRTMIDDAELLYEGLEYVHRLLGIENIVVAIERNKPEAIRSMKALCDNSPFARVQVLEHMYPQGGKINLIYNVTGRIVPEGGRPGDVGCIVTNCTTLASIMRYIITGIPMIKKRVTVDGSAVKHPKNLLVPLGTPIRDVFEYAGGLRDDVGKVVTGGPMMGSAIPDLGAPIVKGTNTLLAFTKKDSVMPKPTDCIRCGKCVAGCPMQLMPVELHDAFLRSNPEKLHELKANMCVECGCCAYVCPARRPLTQYLKLAKATLREWQKVTGNTPAVRPY